jgi:uncharacterized membrane protein YecN with MAPEG domain
MTKKQWRIILSSLLFMLIFMHFTVGLAWHNYVVGVALVGTLIHAWFFQKETP